jgi:putative cell wall-binding protein
MVRRLWPLLVVALVVGLAPASDADAGPRLAGIDRYATAAAVAHASFSAGVPVAFVVTGNGFVDALTAGPAAAERGGPVLLVGQKTIPQSTADELTRLQPKSIVVVGGTGAVSDTVFDGLRRYTTGSLTRVSGADRYASSAAVSSSTFPSAAVAYVAGAERFSDALAGAPVAHHERAPLLLVARSSVPGSVATELRRLHATRVVILGGTASVDASAESQLRSIVGDVVRVAGADRYETSVRAAQRAFPTSTIAYLASGAGYADALAAGPAAALAPGPILSVRANCVPKVVSDELFRLGATRIVLLGGMGALGTGVERLTVCPYSAAPNRAPNAQSGSGNVWNDAAPDPDLVRFGSTWYLYSTGTRWGNHIGVLVSSSPNSGWHTTTGKTYGSTALPNPPRWATPNTTWAPGVYLYRGHYVMFYAARVASVGRWCVTVAVSSSPTGPFTDSSTGPMICQTDIGGSIDPQPFIDADGKPWLLWKNNDGSTADVSKVWVAPLDLGGGTAVAGPVRVLMAKNTQLYTWQSTVDNPQKVIAGGQHYLFYSSGQWDDDTYRVGYAVCAGPTGPCTSGPQPILQSYGSVAGPGGGTVEQGPDGRWWLSYHAWDASCTSDACGGVRRLYVTPLAFR